MPDDSRPAQHEDISVRPQNRANANKIQWISFSNLDFEPPKWLISGLIPAESLVMLFGARGLGKTFLALDIAACVASGEDCLGRKVDNPGRVGYLLAERPEGLKRRLSGWLAHRDLKKKALDNMFAAYSQMLNIDEPSHFSRLVKSIGDGLAIQAADKAKIPLKLLVIDPLAAHMDGSENEATSMAKFTNALRKLSKIFNCSILLVHHEGKKNFNNRLGARGSSALEAALDTILYASVPEPHRADRVRIQMTKQREFEESPEIWIEMKEAKGKIPDHKMEDMALGKFPVLTSAPEKSSNSKRKARVDKELEDQILKFVAECAPQQEGVTILEIEKYLIDWNQQKAEADRKTLVKDFARRYTTQLRKSNRIALLNGGKKPHKYGPAA